MLDNSDISPCYTDRDVATSEHDRVYLSSEKLSTSQSSQFVNSFLGNIANAQFI